MTSWPAWCLLLLQFGNLWGLFFLLTAAPKFVSEILGFQLTGTGVLASAPYLARWLASFAWAWLGRRVLAQSDWSLVNVRRFFSVFCENIIVKSFAQDVILIVNLLLRSLAHILPGLCFIAVPYAASWSPFACIAILALSQAFNGAAPQSTFATFHDIAPNYAVTMVSIINTCGSMSALISPLVVAYRTAAEGNTIEAWRGVFFVGAAVYILPALLFCVAGSASVQRWDSCKPETDRSIVKGVEAAEGKHVAATTAGEKKGRVQGTMYGPLYGM